jgi:hypothetical protein
MMIMQQEMATQQVVTQSRPPLYKQEMATHRVLTQRAAARTAWMLMQEITQRAAASTPRMLMQVGMPRMLMQVATLRMLLPVGTTRMLKQVATPPMPMQLRAATRRVAQVSTVATQTSRQAVDILPTTSSRGT